MRVKVGSDQAITAWSATNYGQQHNVFMGLNPEDPPPREQYPLVVFDPDTKSGGVSADQETKIAITCGLYDDSQPVQVAENVFVHPAVANLESFRDLVITSAAAALPEGAIIVAVEDEFDREQPFPHYHLMQTVLTIIRPYQFRENILI